MTHSREPFSFVFSDVGRSAEREYGARKGFQLTYRAIIDELMVPLSARMIDLIGKSRLSTGEKWYKPGIDYLSEIRQMQIESDMSLLRGELATPGRQQRVVTLDE